VPFFRDCPQLFIDSLSFVLVPLYILPGQDVLEQGSFGEEMYFIQSGELEVVIKGMVVKVLEEGMFFGGTVRLLNSKRFATTIFSFLEVAVLVGNTKRTATIRATSHCVLYVLRKKDLEPILCDFPEVKAHFLEIAQIRFLSKS
jgi:CRP-like cAMP-binding protein